MKSIAVVGASLAGIRTAQELRDQGFDGRLTLVGDEVHLPYDRPPLSKGYLAGTGTRASLALVDDEDLPGLDLDLRLGVRAVALDAAAGRIRLEDGGEIAADGIVIATGGRARTLPGTDGVAGVHVLRTLDDADALRADLTTGSPRVVVVGGGFIGAEVASTCRTLGLDVTVLDTLETPMAPALGPEIAAACNTLHAGAGAVLRCRAVVSEVVAAPDADGPRVTAVRLADGEVLPADVVVVGIGIVPATAWLEGSGLELGNGVRVDEGLRTASPTVVAVGDVACPTGRRHEHWTSAGEQAPVAAANLLAGTVSRPFRSSGYVWSDQYGRTLQLAGHPHAGDVVSYVDGRPDEGRFVAVYRRDGAVTGVFGMGDPRGFTRTRREHLGRPAR